MKCVQSIVFLTLTFVSCKVHAKTGYGHGEQDWGYVDVREGAHIFYWLYHTTAQVANYTDRPLVIWLQGGPGSSSTGNGNFEQLGPIDVDGKNRTSTWIKNVNVLFVDSPVGCGFSYVSDKRYFATNNSQIAVDLLTFTKNFYTKHPEFVKVPLHIFTESYGGKMGAEFAVELYKAIQNNEICCNLTSVVLGDPWISGIDSVLSWAPFLFNTGIVDEDGFNKIMVAANKTLELVQKESWLAAAWQYADTATIVDRESKGVNIYNIEYPTKLDSGIKLVSDLDQSTMLRYNVNDYREGKLDTLMRGPVTQALGIPGNVIWGSQRDIVFEYLLGDFMKPVVNKVSELLDKTNLKVGIFSGQLDMVCATSGTLKWINKLQWAQRVAYINAPRKAINVSGILEGYKKSGGNLSMFWINRAGHMAVEDNPGAINHVLRKITKYNKK